VKLPNNPQSGQPIHASWGRTLLNYLRHLPISGGPGIRVQRTGGGITISATRKAGKGGTSNGSWLQITKTPPWNYDSATEGALTENDFFVSFGLYNGLIPTDIDTKITISGETHVYLGVVISSVNPAYTTSVEIATDTVAPVNAAPVAGEFPATVYVPIGKIEDNDGSWVVTNYGNGGVAGSVYLSSFSAGSDGVLESTYGYSYARVQEGV